MKFINKYLRNFTPYKLASHKIWQVEADKRKDILKLDWNEATIAPSPKVAERISRLVMDGQFYNLYPSTYNEELIELLSNYIEIKKTHIQYFASSDSLHEYIAKLYITVGDPVLILGPTYDNFRLTAEVCGADLHFYNIPDDFQFDRDAFISSIRDIDPSLVYICNPNNPTGTQHSIDYIEELLVEFPQTLFLIDEAYAEFSGVSCKDLTLKYENILISRTMSKAFAIANFRFGYLIASEKNIEYISSIRNSKNITTFAQEAACGALSDIEYMEEYVKEVNEAKKLFSDSINGLGGISVESGGGNFVLLKCQSNQMKRSLLDFLEKRSIFVRNVSQTEMLKNYCIRITIGTRDQMEIVAKEIKEYVDGV